MHWECANAGNATLDREFENGKEAKGQHAVSKTVVPKGIAGSNPVFSAEQ